MPAVIARQAFHLNFSVDPGDNKIQAPSVMLQSLKLMKLMKVENNLNAGAVETNEEDSAVS